MLFGWLLERRHGPVVPLLVFFTAGAAGMAVAASAETLGANVVSGANGAALALLCAWAVPSLAARRRGEDTDSDMLGVAVIAAVLLLLPVAVRRGRSARRAGRRRRGLRVRLSAGRGQPRTLIAPAGPSTSRPITAPGTSPARAGGTAASSPPEVIASVTRRRRAGSMPVRKRRELGRVLGVAAAAAADGGFVGQQRRARRRSRARRRRRPRRPRRWPASARAGGPAGRSRSRRSARARRRRGPPPRRRAFSVVMTATARATASSPASPRLTAVEIAPAPSGLVSTSASPARAAGVA